MTSTAGVYLFDKAYGLTSVQVCALCRGDGRGMRGGVGGVWEGMWGGEECGDGRVGWQMCGVEKRGWGGDIAQSLDVLYDHTHTHTHLHTLCPSFLLDSSCK